MCPKVGIYLHANGKLILEGGVWFGSWRVCGKLPMPDGKNYVSLYSVMNTSNT